jgi:tetratricopeptide (TPR) repeat protein
VPPTPTPEPTATPAPLSAEAILQATFDASQQASSYRFEMDMQMTLAGPDIGADMEIPMVFVGDVQLPDRMQGTMTVSVDDIDVETQVVVIGDESYVKNPLTDQWQLNPQTTTMFNPEDLVVDPDDIQDLELLGEETLDGMPVYHLSGRATLPFSFEEPLGQVETDMLVDYWVGQEDLRLVQSFVEGDIEFGGQVQATATVSMTMRLLDYDVPMEISAPEIAQANVISVPEVGPIPIQATLLAPLESDTPEGHVQRGLASLADGRLGLAVAHFQRALELRPGWPEALLYRGATLAIDGDLAQAFADLDQAVEVEPERADAYALRAWAHMRAIFRDEWVDEYEDSTAMEWAREDIARALELDLDLPAARSLQASATVLEALALYESEPDQAIADFEAAMADLQALMEQDPDTAAGYFLSFAQSGELIFLASHPYGVDSVAWSPDGRLLVTGGPDGLFRVWDAGNGAELSSGMAATLWWEEGGQ